MRKLIDINNDWEFTPRFSSDFLSGGGEADIEIVRLPHTCKVTPFHYFDESIYQMVCGYRRRLDLSDRGSRRAFIWLTVELDTRESLNFPPFGKVIDYLTYGGLYREVRLEYREHSYLDDVFAKPSVPDVIRVSSKAKPRLVAGLRFDGVIDCEIDIVGEADEVRMSVIQKDAETALSEVTVPVGGNYTITVPRARLWDPLSPVLYELKTELIRDGEVIDTLSRRVGFRRAEFKKDGFYLNGRKFKLRGLNRHQSYPYVGYAMPRSMQRLDADILKNELGCNAVRTSHYPQSHHFIGRCDELGMPVFTEAPGWQNLGDEEWKDVGVEAVREMVREYRNHPSIILWGVRINESQDDHDFYVRTNEAARSLDPTRATGGVRCHKNSELLEDVYTYNDFVHDGIQPGCEPKRDVTSDMDKAYLISEYGGHMYSTKAFDDEEHRLEHMLRHARVLDAVASHDDIAGSFAWCMFDYNTHKEFGSGDRICYHGVCDMFRNKKLAAELYAVQDSKEPILRLSSSMDIGDHPATNRGRVYILTNADSVRFYKNDSFICEYTHEGDSIAENEDFAEIQAEFVKDILNESSRFGMNNLSAGAKSKAAYLMMRYGMDHDAAYRLYGKYIGNWGDKSVMFRFEAYKNGKLVKELKVAPFEKRVLAVEVDHTELIEDKTYDVAAVRIRMTDQNGNTLPYFFGTVGAQVSGGIELIAESPVLLRAGMGGVYVRTKGKKGKATLTLTADGCESVSVDFRISARSSLY